LKQRASFLRKQQTLASTTQTAKSDPATHAPAALVGESGDGVLRQMDNAEPSQHRYHQTRTQKYLLA
jgi:hypothetical protein